MVVGDVNRPTTLEEELLKVAAVAGVSYDDLDDFDFKVVGS